MSSGLALSAPTSIDLGFDLYVEIAGAAAKVRVDSAAGLPFLERLFGPVRTEPRVGVDAAVEVFLREPTPRIRLSFAGEPCDLSDMFERPGWQRFVREPDAHRVLYRDTVESDRASLEILNGELIVLRPGTWPLYVQIAFLWMALKYYPVINLHAAVSAVQGHALVFLGPSGSGKSTLSWALHAAGADYYGDEWAFFSLPDYRLHTWERSVCLRPGGIEALGSPFEAPQWFENKPGDPKYSAQLRRPEARCPEDRVSLFFMDGFAEQPALVSLRKSEAIRWLIRGMGHGDPDLAPRLEAAAGLVDRYPCWRLRVGPPEETAAQLARYARQSG